MSTLLKRSAISAMAVAVLLFAGCSQSTTPSSDSEAAKAPAGPPQVVTAKTAFGPMYKSALAWSSDVQILRMTPREVTGFTNGAGKAALWEAAFASANKRQLRVYFYAIATVPPDVHKGVNANIALPWAGPSRDAMPIDLALFSVDSDGAYQAAAADADAWLKKNPTKTLTTIELGSNYKFRAPVWYVSWGDKKLGYIAFVDATSGNVYKSK
jgi:hypothetical protein